MAELVARLEGIPLAIELAAARIRALSVADINARLQDRYKLLTGGSRVLQERQQTLRALVDWSYELLTPEEQIVLDRLGVFVGGFDLAAAEAVCGMEPLAGEDVLDLLQSLIEKSLVMLEERDDGARYLMLETIREYAREKLALRDDAAAVAARHCEHYFAMAKSASNGLKGPQQAEWLWKVEVELDNIRSAIALSLARRQSTRSSPSSSRSRCRASGSCAATRPKAGSWCRRRWRCPRSRRRRSLRRGRSTSVRHWPRARATMPRHSGCWRPASSCGERWATKSTSPPRYRRCRSRVCRRATPSRPRRARARRCRSSGASMTASAKRSACLHLGQIWLYQGDDATARSHLEQCLAVAHEIRHQEVEGECELVLGEVALETSDVAQACLRFKRSLTVCREAGDKRGEANALRWLARVDLQSGDLASARARFSEALRAFRAFEMRDELLGCLEDHAELAEAEGKLEVAVGLAAAAARSRDRLGLHRSPRASVRWQALVGRLRRAMTDAPFDTAWDDAQQLQTDEAISQALSAQRERATA